ncbi:radical SAM protein [Aurantivibrio infirmus]
MSATEYMSKQEIEAIKPASMPDENYNPFEFARDRLKKVGQYSKRQQLGNRFSIGCVALEITQRCNLDCTCCYLSENSEAVKDLPLDEIFRRIDLIYSHHGKGTAVQITGGDPTLRKMDELMQIVRQVRDKGMRPTLFTNGIKTTRPYMEELAAAGLVDIALHVDMTQERKGYNSEIELNEIRQKYIENARGLGISVFFNFTVTRESFHAIPELVQFYIKNADVVRTVSFQLQADTGRGVERERDIIISQDSVRAQINKGAGLEVNFDASPIGHTKCNKYGMCFEVNGKLYNALDDSEFVEHIISSPEADWADYSSSNAFVNLYRWLSKNPSHIFSGLAYAARMVWKGKFDIIKAKGKVNRLSFFIHNFMDACHLESDRIEACTFQTITRDGPISMCLLNAKRDDYILQPVEVVREEQILYWQPLTGELDKTNKDAVEADPLRHHLKRLKGRSRKTLLEQKENLSKVAVTS